MREKAKRKGRKMGKLGRMKKNWQRQSNAENAKTEISLARPILEGRIEAKTKERKERIWSKVKI